MKIKEIVTYPIDREYLRERILNQYCSLADGTQEQIDKLVDRLNHPETYDDLSLIAALCHYKRGWAYYEAKKLNIPVPERSYKNYSRRRSNYYSEGGAYGIVGDDDYCSCYDYGICPWGDS